MDSPMHRVLHLALWLLAPICSLLGSAPEWSKTRWHDEPAWISTSQGFDAIVTETRARLIYFGPAGGTENLLSAPTPLECPSAANVSPNWGGHRFWLGPQSRWKWPPVADWEFSAAAQVTTSEGILTVRHAHSVGNYPSLVREYTWENGRLRCTVRWQDDGRPYYGMHVFAIEVPAAIDAKLAKWEHVPHGVVGINGDTPNATAPVPHPAVAIDGGIAHIRSGVAVAKLGFFPQPLEVTRGKHRLIVHPGPTQGTAIETPDFGYVTQIWVGAGSAKFAELEQITPYLIGQSTVDRWCASTVYLEAK
jgi:hypothetical protein